MKQSISRIFPEKNPIKTASLNNIILFRTWLLLFLSMIGFIGVQEVVSSLLFKWDLVQFAKIIILGKEFCFLGMTVVSIFILRFWFIVYLAIVASFWFLLALFSGLNFVNSLIEGRMYLIYAIGLVMGYRMKDCLSSSAGIFSYFMTGIAFFLISTTFLEHYIFRDSFYSSMIPFAQVQTDLKQLTGYSINSETGMMVNAYTSYGEKRIVGPFADPLYMAYFTLPIAFYFIWSWISKGGWISPFLAIALILIVLFTYVKAMIIGLLIVFPLMLVFRRPKMFLVTGVILLTSLVLDVSHFDDLAIEALSVNEGSAVGHYEAYTEGIPRVLSHPLGIGMGAAGLLGTQQMGFAYGDFGFGVENFIVNIGIELGLIPMLLVAIFFIITVLICLYKIMWSVPLAPLPVNWKSGLNDEYMPFWIIASTLCFSITAFISPQIFTGKTGLIVSVLHGASVGFFFSAPGSLRLISGIYFDFPANSSAGNREKSCT